MIIEFRKPGKRMYEDLPRNEEGLLKIQVPESKEKRVFDLIKIIPDLGYEDLWLIYRDVFRMMAIHNKADEAERSCNHMVYM